MTGASTWRVALSLWLAACARAAPGPPVAGPAAVIALFSADTAIQDEWQRVPLRGETEYRLTVIGGQLAIRAVARGSASGLLRPVEVDPRRCPWIEWSWRIERIQAGADLRDREREDVAASLFVFFGDPGLMIAPTRVPTLRYVWTNERLPVESVIDSPYLPGTVRSLVVESGEARAGQWLVERRNLVADFERAFGSPPPEAIQAIALFTDNDQTREPVEAYYAWARVRCGPAPGARFPGHPASRPYFTESLTSGRATSRWYTGSA